MKLSVPSLVFALVFTMPNYFQLKMVMKTNPEFEIEVEESF